MTKIQIFIDFLLFWWLIMMTMCESSRVDESSIMIQNSWTINNQSWRRCCWSFVCWRYKSLKHWKNKFWNCSRAPSCGRNINFNWPYSKLFSSLYKWPKWYFVHHAIGASPFLQSLHPTEQSIRLLLRNYLTSSWRHQYESLTLLRAATICDSSSQLCPSWDCRNK